MNRRTPVEALTVVWAWHCHGESRGAAAADGQGRKKEVSPLDFDPIAKIISGGKMIVTVDPGSCGSDRI